MEKESFFVEMKVMAGEYIDDRLLLLKLQATEKAAKISALLFIGIIVGLLGLVIFMIASYIAGYYLSMAVGSYPAGFAILAGIYVVFIFLMVFIHKKYTAKLVENSVVKFSLHNDNSFTHEV